MSIENNGHCQQELLLPLECNAMQWRNFHFLENESVMFSKKTLHTSRGRQYCKFCKGTASLKGHVAFKNWYVFGSFQSCILEIGACFFEKELSFFTGCFILKMRIVFFERWMNPAPVHMFPNSQLFLGYARYSNICFSSFFVTFSRYLHPKWRFPLQITYVLWSPWSLVDARARCVAEWILEANSQQPSAG